MSKGVKCNLLKSWLFELLVVLLRWSELSLKLSKDWLAFEKILCPWFWDKFLT
jgi:hypothetical protein